jgi:predicted phosphodiesterase
MRLAAISDIHGNLPALEAVLAEIAAESVDLIVNLGDIVSGPLWPRETAQRLMALGLPTIRGNHERQLLTLPLDHQSDTDAQANRALREDELAWLRSLPAALELDGGVLCCHGTPSSDCQYLLETPVIGFDASAARRGGATARGLRAATADEVLARLGAIQGRLLLCGHSHVPRALALPGGVLAVNPGSVGLPAYDEDLPLPHWVENGDPTARWALMEWLPDGRWRVALRSTAYDHEDAARRAEANGRGDWADALRTGRVGRTEREAPRGAP